MVALLDDVSRLHDENYIRIAYGRKAMRHDKARAPFHQAIKGLLNFEFRSCVNGRSRLVQDEHGGIAHHNAGNAEELALSLREALSVLGNDRIIAVRKPLDKACNVAGARHFTHLFFRNAGISHGDVFAYGAAL